MSERWQNAVAIIGVAGRFPGADNVEQLWHNLCEGRESIRPIATEELEDGLTEAQRGNGKYVAARALLDNVDMFDAEFFRILPREAEVADPQQRVLMECAWEALEDAGYDPDRIAGNVGVFAGSSINTYLLLHLASNPGFREEFTRSYQVGSFPALVGNGHDFLATRISYKLNLRGPAMTVQSACSTSLSGGGAGMAEPDELSIGPGAGGRSFDFISAASRIFLSGWRDGFRRRPLPSV